MPFERSSFSFLFVGLGACLVAYWATAFSRPELIDLANMTIPLVMGGVLLYAAYRNVLHNHLLIWTPLPHFLISCALFFSVGASMYHFGSEDLVLRVEEGYSITGEELLRTNMLNVAGILIVLCALYTSLRLFSSVQRIIPNRRAGDNAVIQLKLGATILLCIGLPLKYLLILPYEFKIIEFTVPGMLYQLQNTVPIAIVMLCILAHRRGGIWTAMFYGVAVAELFSAVLTFSKRDVLLTLIMITLGYFVVYPRARTLIAGFCAVLVAYVLLVPLALYGRTETSQFADGAGLADRFQIVQKYLAEATPDDAGGQPQTWWGRLSYAKYQAFVMAEYDAGRPGETVEIALYIPIPRALWPDKPVITGVGRDLYYMLTGRTTTQIAAGIFAEAYWNGGWLLVIVVCIYVGILYAGFTIYSLRRMALQQFFFLPVVFFGILSGLSTAGWFATTYVGSVLIAILMHWVLVAILAVIPTRRLFSPRPA